MVSHDMNRRQEIVNILLESKEPVTISEIARRLQVSDRTIRSDLVTMDPIIRKHELELLKKPRVGIQILGDKQHKQQLLIDFYQKQNPIMDACSKEKREVRILAKLLEGKSRLYVDYFARTLYTSKSSIEKDLVHITQWLKEHKLYLIRKENQGLYIDGSEMDIRNAYAIVLSSMKEDGISLQDLIKEYTGVSIEKIEHIITACESEQQLYLGESNVKNLAFHIAITIKRIQDHKIIQIMREGTSSVNYQENAFIKTLINRLETMANLHFPEQEIDYIVLHLTGMTLDYDQLNIFDSRIPQLRLLADTIADEFITNVEQIVCLGLANNASFRESLITHLLPTIYRLKSDLNLYNPLLKEIKENYAAIFALAGIVNTTFKKTLGIEAGEGEIAFIALHLSIAIEHAKSRRNIAIVCPMGRGISRFLLIKLEENFPGINFLNYSKKELEQDTSSLVDMVISTIELETDKPYVVIRPILSKEDIRNIQLLISQGDFHNKKYFSLQSILMVHTGKTKEKLLADIAHRLQSGGYVDPTFYNGLLEREKMGSTEIGNGIVLTHGFHEAVIRSQIVFAHLKHPVLWNSEPIYFVVVMAIAAGDARHVAQMDWLYKTLNNSRVMNQIQTCETAIEVYEILVKEHAAY